jgi:hypothetical protein
MSGAARHHRHRRRHWADHDSQLCSVFLAALARWVLVHANDPAAQVVLPTGRVGVEELNKRITRAGNRAPGGVPAMKHELRSIIPLPPCGRGRGPCLAIIEINSTGGVFLRCITCNCIAPYRGSGNHA